MKTILNIIIMATAFLLGGVALAQDATPAPTSAPTPAPTTPSDAGALSLGGYAEAAYQAADEARIADVRRAVLFVGYRFSNTARFVSELETEHARELEVEQAFVELAPWKNAPHVRAGLVLVPLGIINEFHEPPTFLGVDRPVVDTLLLPSTWREMGAGVSGDLGEDLHYRAYVLNGLDGDTFSAESGIAPGRGQGAFAHANEAAGAVRATWTGLLGTEIGIGGYYGGAAADVKELQGVAVGIAEVDARVERAGVRLRAEAVDLEIVNAQKVVAFQHAADPTVEAIGASARGGYVEAGYDVLHLLHATQELVPFARFEALDLKARLAPGDGNLGTPAGHRHRRYLFTGLVWKPERRIALKADYRVALKEPAEVEPAAPPAGGEDEEAEEALPQGNTLSLGIGVMF